MTDLELVSDFVERLARAGIRSVVGGSMASSVWGQPRQTNDADISVWLRADQVQNLVAALPDPYNLVPDEVEEATRSTVDFASFKVLHMDEVFSFDCFVHGDSEWTDALWDTRRVVGTLAFLGPEAILVLKLRWFVLGNKVSDRQWNDICQVIEVQGDRLDRSWAQLWATRFGVDALLEQALAQARP